MKKRTVRRVAGFLAARLPELGLEEVPDPRAREGRWSWCRSFGRRCWA
jgi:hypothetical protein